MARQIDDDVYVIVPKRVIDGIELAADRLTGGRDGEYVDSEGVPRCGVRLVWRCSTLPEIDPAPSPIIPPNDVAFRNQNIGMRRLP